MNVGIVGTGAVVRRGHLPAYGVIPEVKIAGIADIDKSLAEKVAREFGIHRYYSTCEELLKDDSLDIIDICTPPSFHASMIEMAALKGKAVLVEKPLSVSLADAIKIEKIVKESGIKLCVVQNWRYFPAISHVYSRISKGYLGDIVSIHGVALAQFPVNWTLGTWLYEKGGALSDFGPHLIDIILYLKNFIKVKRVYASGGDFSHGNMDFINYAIINIEFEDGTVATADTSWVTSTAPKFIVDIYGTAGNIFLDVRNNAFSETHGFPTPLDDLRYFLGKTLKTGTGILTGNYFKGALLNYKPLIQDFISSINSHGKIPIPVEHAILTMAVLEAAQKSIQEHSPILIEEIMNGR